jgi:Baseplate J-like protein
MALPSKSLSQYVSDQVAAWAQQLGYQPTLPDGDPLLALMYATAAQAVFLQAQIQIVNGLTLASTRTGQDLDDWMAQFDFPRLGATTATGSETFGKNSPASSPIQVPPGVTVQTVGGAVQYVTVADPTQPTWSPSLNAYVLAPGQSTLTATIQAAQAGSASNVTAGQLSQLGTNVPGIDYVTNAAAINNGLSAESDSAYLARFVQYLNSLSKATYGAIVSAIEGVQQNLLFSLQENVTTGGTPRPGEFVATIDDGSGAPPASLIAAVQAALEQVRGFTILAETIAVTTVTAIISIVVRLAPSTPSLPIVPSVVKAAVAAAVELAVNSQPIGGEDEDGSLLYISQVEAAALTVPGVISVQPGTLINGVNADLTGSLFQRSITTLNNISVANY